MGAVCVSSHWFLFVCTWAPSPPSDLAGSSTSVMIFLRFTDMLWEPMLPSRYIRSGCWRCAQILSSQLWGVCGGRAVCSLKRPGYMLSFLCVPGYEKGGKHYFTAHGSEAFMGNWVFAVLLWNLGFQEMRPSGIKTRQNKAALPGGISF